MATVFCIGRNYADHAIEMGAPPVAIGDPVVFLKQGLLLAYFRQPHMEARHLGDVGQLRQARPRLS